MLLLDEATSALDTANELALRHTITRLAQHTTHLVIAHRMATVTAANTVAVLDAGTVRLAAGQDCNASTGGQEQIRLRSP